MCAGAAVHAMASTGAGLHVSGSWRACATSVRTIFKPMNSNELLLLSTLVPLHLSEPRIRAPDSHMPGVGQRAVDMCSDVGLRIGVTTARLFHS